MDVASKIRDQYLPKRAREIALTQAIEVITAQVEKAEAVLGRFREAQKRVAGEIAAADAAATALRSLAAECEIDLADRTLGESLSGLVEKTMVHVFESLGFTKPSDRPGGNGTAAKPPTHGTMAVQPRAIVRPPPPPASSQVDEPAPAAATEPKRLVKVAQEGPISTVTPRAKAALAKAHKGAKDSQGVTHRADALVDENGRTIPVTEQITIDDAAPQPGESGDEDDKGGVKTHGDLPDDDPLNGE